MNKRKKKLQGAGVKQIRRTTSRMLLAGFFFCLVFSPEEGTSMFLRNIIELLLGCTALHPTILVSLSCVCKTCAFDYLHLLKALKIGCDGRDYFYEYISTAICGKSPSEIRS
jgi:hypothetical protein